MPVSNHKKNTIKRALLSVSDKTDIVELAKTLIALDIEILSTSGTARKLHDAGIKITEISDYTGFPEIMDGRVKTLHPKVHGALLGRRGADDVVMQSHRIQAIDLVVVNLYPFVQAIQQKDCTLNQAIENIDIGGPAMIRSAAKNHRDVTVIVDPADYPMLMSLLKQNGCGVPYQQRLLWAGKAFSHTAAYDSVISRYLAEINDDFANSLGEYVQVAELRYGENPHQRAVLYIGGGHHCTEQIQGKELSYNNYLDLDSAIALVSDFGDMEHCVCAIIKHTNPCGVACGSEPIDAYMRAYATDPQSAFGGIIAFNCALDEQTAVRIIEQQFVEVIAALEVSDAAKQVLTKKPSVRLMTYKPPEQKKSDYSLRSIAGGLLVQQKDNSCITGKDLSVAGKYSTDDKQIRDLVFAARVVKHAKSNAIVYARELQTLGIGAGQMSRIDAMKMAMSKAQQAKLSLHQAVLASDAFFPFADSIEYAAEIGIGAVVQPGGSLKDSDVIATADQNGIAMVFSGIRNFKH